MLPLLPTLLLLLLLLLLLVTSPSRVHSNPSLPIQHHSQLFAKLKLRQHHFCSDAHPLGQPKEEFMAFKTVTLNQANPFGQGACPGDPSPKSMYVYKGRDVVSDSIAGGGWEVDLVSQVMWAMKQVVPHSDSDFLLDIGANLAWFSLAAACQGYRVAAFEAMPQNQQLIRSSLCDNPHLMDSITLFPIGLGAAKDTCYIVSHHTNRGDGMAVCGQPSAAAAIAASGLWDGTPYEVRNTFHVETLDSIIQEDVKVIKMDVEGFELKVLQGAKALFSKHTVWFMALELNLAPLARTHSLNGADVVKEYIQTLDDYKFKISLTSFNGPFLDPKTEMDTFVATAKRHDNFQLWCTHKDFQPKV